MCLPDQSYIDQVRDALWNRPGGASVMVGAGFSKNAYSLVPDADIPPTLDNLKKSLSKELYPCQGRKDSGSTNNQLVKSDNFPLLAQEYEVAFGRGRLIQFLQGLIRDDQLKPMGVHERLLSLPWRDVFTTNWDTLLEKSRDFVPDRKYSVLRNKDEIPLADQPRIVKLHGSFPAYFPLICTQDDYRTYPVKFAPFVNTVQQAMMETVFLLVGFSGDDPNFIHWTGWVRDNLGESAPKIYLAGWLDLSLNQRRVLEYRNVVAIDLARHPKADKWPEHQRHEYAIKWILHTLEHGEPYMITNWPLSQTRDNPPICDHLQPVMEITADVPKEEPRPDSESGSGDILAQVDRIVKIWAYNRNLYPGWLVVPVSVRREISYFTDGWEPKILSALPKLDPVLQLETIYELIWRREVLLDPLLSDVELAAQDILQKIDCEARTVAGESRTEIEWSDVRQGYRNVMLALVTTARLRFDHETFEKRLEALGDFQNDDPNVTQRIHHERCLWAIYSLDYKSLLDLLSNWSPEDCDPFWMIRKATLLYEINRVDEAKELATRALSAIRRIPDDSRSVGGPSREGWSLELTAVIESTISWMRYDPDQDEVKYPPDLSDFYARRRELAAKKCDTLSEIREYKSALAPEHERGVVPAFDLHMKRVSGIHFSNAEQERLRAAYRAIRLSEVAGLPTFSFDTLKSAAEELSVSEPEMAVRLILRTSSYDKDNFLERILSRSHVALMPLELARKLVNICDGIIKYALQRIGVVDAAGQTRFWVERMRVAVEVLSRLVVRLNPDDVEEVFNKSLTAYNNVDIIQEFWLGQPLCNTLKRSWRALPKQRQVARILDLLGAPILGVGNTADPHFRYPIPNDLSDRPFTPPDRTNENEGRWQRIVSQLIFGLNEDGEVRMRSSHWVFQISSWERLTEKEIKKVAQALWHEKFMEPTGLPRETGLHEWAFMVLPETELGLAERRFRKKYLSDEEGVKGNEKELGNILFQIGLAISGLKAHEKSLVFSEAEQRFLIDILWQWYDAPMPAPKNSFDFVIPHPVGNEIGGVSKILTEIKIPTDLAERLYQKMNGLSDLGFPAFGFIPGLSTVLESRFDELTEIMRLGLISQNEDTAQAALQALDRWLLLAVEPNSSIQTPPDNLVREIGVIIATRRKETLGLALQGAKWIFDKGSDTQKQDIQDMALNGLTYLLEELRYDRKNVGQNNDLPNLRNYSVQLASSMYEHGLRNNDTTDRWLQVAKNDPLPELRYAIDPV
ncbi:MAG: SIR2 family protein [Rhodothermaceae bacterium]|nr:SIR2 family protein [Rhodothermaceae bacterium]MYG70258.1 SIR2 family protein [Rhodothermaceae bacterium]MYJ45914.1 SIR2 family protein [Rhodothermaceae bacterium]